MRLLPSQVPKRRQRKSSMIEDNQIVDEFVSLSAKRHTRNVLEHGGKVSRHFVFHGYYVYLLQLCYFP